MREPRMTCFFSLIVWYIGEVGAMAFGRLASTIYILVGVSSLAQKNEKDACVFVGDQSIANHFYLSRYLQLL